MLLLVVVEHLHRLAELSLILFMNTRVTNYVCNYVADNFITKINRAGYTVNACLIAYRYMQRIRVYIATIATI